MHFFFTTGICEFVNNQRSRTKIALNASILITATSNISFIAQNIHYLLNKHLPTQKSFITVTCSGHPAKC